LAFAGDSVAQTDGKDATVRVPWAEVRGNRSELFPVTGMLRQGQAVRVLREEDGYFAVVPPAGSSNWIDDHFVKPIEAAGGRRPTRAYVLTDGTPVRLGSDKASGPLQFETVKLNRGTIVV